MPADETQARTLADLGAATLGESGGLPMKPRIRAAWRGSRISAPAYPVKCTPGDNLAIHVAVTCAGPGDVLVVDVGDLPERGYWGEVLATAALSRGLAGLVIDGGVRDVAALEALRFPVFSATVALRGASKTATGRVGGSERVGGVEVGRGDWVVGDEDGVTVVRAGEVQEVIAAGNARAEKEKRLFTELRAGATTLELLGLDASPVERQAT